MSEHTKLIAELRAIRYGVDKQDEIRYANAIDGAIEALRGIQSKADDRKDEADMNQLEIDECLKAVKLRHQNMIDRIKAEILSEKAAAYATLRNQFAAAALSGFLAANETDYLIAIENSFECADRMLAESKK